MFAVLQLNNAECNLYGGTLMPQTTVNRADAAFRKVE